MSYAGKRAGPRHDLRVAVTVQTNTGEFAATFVDVSSRGAYVQAEEVVQAGTPVKVRLQIDGHDVDISGKTVRNAFSGSKGPGFAMEFDLDATAIIERLSSAVVAEQT